MHGKNNMSKIVKVYALMNTEKSLLQTISGGIQIEEGVWDNILDKVGVQRKSKSEELPPAETRSDNASSDDVLRSIVERIIDPTDGFEKYGLYLSSNSLASNFLKTGSRKDMAASFVADPEFSKHFIHISDPKFTDFVSASPNRNRMVLMHIPKQLHSQFASTTDPTARAAILEKMLSLNYYVISFNLEELKKICAALDAAPTMADKARLFNPVVVENVPNVGVKNQMRVEWAKLQRPPEDELDTRDAAVSRAEREASIKNREDELEKSKVGNDALNAHTTAIMAILTDKTLKSVNAIKSMLDGYISRNKLHSQRLVSILSELNTSLKSSTINELIKSYETSGKTQAELDRDRIMGGPTSEGFNFRF